MGGRPGRQVKYIRQMAEEFGISLPNSDDLYALQTALRTEIAKRLKDITVHRRVRFRGSLWIVKDIKSAPAGRQGVIYALGAVKGAGRVEVSETVLLRGMQ